jgi:hypothetical protein
MRVKNTNPIILAWLTFTVRFMVQFSMRNDRTQYEDIEHGRNALIQVYLYTENILDGR